MKLSALIFLAVLFVSCANPSEKILSSRINHVMLYVKDMDASVSFYTAAFDLQETNRIKQLKVTKADSSSVTRDIEIVFLKFPGQDFVYELVQNPNPNDSATIACLFQHIGVDVMDIDAALRQALAAGGTLLAPIQTVSTKDINVKQAFIAGPNGESIELMQMLTGEF